MADAKSPLLLILDQVEVINRPDWASTVLTRIVKARYDDGKPTVITTSKNIDLAQTSLENCLDFGHNVVRFVETLGEEG
jgi:DNA replication protein DnaC